jgi:hypothetical protein
VFFLSVANIKMSQCKAMTQHDKPCSRSALKSGYCAQHDKDQKLQMYRKELAKMHQRVRRYLEISNDLNSKILDIQQVDYFKSELIKIGGNSTPFRAIIDNPFYKDRVEDLFDLTIDNCPDAYNEMLNRRNKLVHPHTIDGWNGKRFIRAENSQKGQFFLRKGVGQRRSAHGYPCARIGSFRDAADSPTCLADTSRQHPLRPIQSLSSSRIRTP